MFLKLGEFSFVYHQSKGGNALNRNRKCVPCPYGGQAARGFSKIKSSRFRSGWASPGSPYGPNFPALFGSALKGGLTEDRQLFLGVAKIRQCAATTADAEFAPYQNELLCCSGF